MRGSKKRKENSNSTNFFARGSHSLTRLSLAPICIHTHHRGENTQHNTTHKNRRKIQKQSRGGGREGETQHGPDTMRERVGCQCTDFTSPPCPVCVCVCTVSASATKQNKTTTKFSKHKQESKTTQQREGMKKKTPEGRGEIEEEEDERGEAYPA